MYSPNQGGVWERMVGLVKSCLYKAFGHYTYTLTQFYTLLSDCKMAINNRPLTYIPSENDLGVITPNMLLYNRTCFPLISISEQNLHKVWEESSGKELLQQIANSFDERTQANERFLKVWFEDYLLALREKATSNKLYNVNNSWVKLGSVCLMQVPTANRATLPLVVITELLPDGEGVVRNVKIRKHDQTITTASVTKLVPLELLIEEREQDLERVVEPVVEPTDPAEAPPLEKAEGRPVRRAAAAQKDLVRHLIHRGAV